MSFEWDEAKRSRNLEKHGIDFIDAAQLFHEEKIYSYPSWRGTERRWVTVGLLSGRLVAILWTERSGTIRIISARRARGEEEGHHRRLFG